MAKSKNDAPDPTQTADDAPAADQQQDAASDNPAITAAAARAKAAAENPNPPAEVTPGNEILPLEEARSIIALGTLLLNAVGEAAADRKLTIADIRSFAKVLPAVPSAFADAAKAIKELHDASPAQWRELVKFAVTRLDVPHGTAEKRVQIAADFALDILEHYQQWVAA